MGQLSIYRQVAKSALMSWNGLTEEDALETVKTQTIEQLENHVWAKSSLNYAIEGIAKLCQNPQLKEQLAEIVMDENNITMTEEQKKFLNNLGKEHEVIGSEKGVLCVLSAIHDGWVKDNSKKFNQEGREERKFQHLPFMLIGWKEAKSDLLFLSPIINAISGPVDLLTLQEAYINNIATFLKSRDIKTKDQLVSKIMEGSEFYAPLSDKNSATSIKEASAMAKKVYEVNPTVSESLDLTTKL